MTSRPSARNAGTRQLWTGLPSSQTVHAPQSPASHPFFTPNQPRLAQERPQALAGTRFRRERLAVDPIAHGGFPVRRLSVGEFRANLFARSNASSACGGPASRARRRGTGRTARRRRSRVSARRPSATAVEAELNRPEGGGGDREHEFAVLGAARADEQRFGSPEVREREPPEGERLAERMGGQEDRSQQFAGREDILVVAGHEIDDGDLPRLAAPRPERGRRPRARP